MGKYINWPDDRREDKKNLAEQLGGKKVSQAEAELAVRSGEHAVLVWVDNMAFDALAWAYDEREFEAMTFPHDRRPKAYFLIDRAVAEQHAKG